MAPTETFETILFTHERSNNTSQKKSFEFFFGLHYYARNICEFSGWRLNLLGKECMVW